jgi:hypothetical protein
MYIIDNQMNRSAGVLPRIGAAKLYSIFEVSAFLRRLYVAA